MTHCTIIAMAMKSEPSGKRQQGSERRGISTGLKENEVVWVLLFVFDRRNCPGKKIVNFQLGLKMVTQHCYSEMLKKQKNRRMKTVHSSSFLFLSLSFVCLHV